MPLLPRREDPHDRRGDRRGAADGDRPRARRVAALFARRVATLSARAVAARRAAGLCGAIVAAALVPASVTAQTPAPGQPGTARIEGKFEMLGKVTVAKDIKGERRGQRATRVWTFNSSCAAGQCGQVALVRKRSAGYYRGTGMFYVPLRCAGHTVRRGESVPFTITIRITGAELVGADDVANTL